LSKVLILYYSAFGYVGILAKAIAEGARSAGAVADIKRVAEMLPDATASDRIFDPMQDDPIALIQDLAHYDAIIVGSPTRYGRLSSPIAAFLEQATEQLGQDVLSGKVGGAFTSPTSAQGGQETASMSLVINLLHLGMIVVGPPFSVTTIADAAGQRYPSELDLDIARQQGMLIARTAQKLKGPGSVL
jgi:NAD(P)H dehydrogenase (quinone)